MVFPGIYFFSSSLEKAGLARECLAGFMLPVGGDADNVGGGRGGSLSGTRGMVGTEARCW